MPIHITMAKKRKGSGLGCLFWVALILLVLVVFLFNKQRIQTVMESTGLLDILAKEMAVPERPEVTRIDQEPSGEKKPESNDEATPSEKRDGPVVEKIDEDDATEPLQKGDHSGDNAIPEAEASDRDTSAETVTITQNQISVQASRQTENMEKAPSNMRKAKLYFVSLNDDSGEIILKGIDRPIFYADSPLTETIKSLLQGLSTTELNHGLLSLIPEDAKIRSVKVVGGIAYIDFTEAIRFNAFGKEGYINQLKQIVYTATEFPTVQAVQILIEGQIHSYIGPEGVYIGEPLTRESL